MNNHPALRRAAILARFGRLQEAIEGLEFALQTAPDNQDIKLEIQLLRSRLERESLPNSLKHQLVGWFLFMSAPLVAVMPAVIVTRSLADSRPTLPTEGAVALLYVLLLLAALLLLLYLGLRLFLWSWFKYLRRLPIEERNFAEGKLALAMNLYVFEPQYSRVRAAHLERTDA